MIVKNINLLSKQEVKYLKLFIKGINPGFEGLDALIKAKQEGRVELDYSDPDVKRWRKRYHKKRALIILNALQFKKDNGFYMSDEDAKRLDDFKKNGTLPFVD